MYACMNCLNRSLEGARAGARRGAGYNIGGTESEAGITHTSEVGLAPRLADKRARMPKFALEEIKLLEQVDLLELLADCLKFSQACLWAIFQVPVLCGDPRRRFDRSILKVKSGIACL